MVSANFHSWKNLEKKISDKRSRVLSSWEQVKTVLGSIDVETKRLNRLQAAVESHTNGKVVEHKHLAETISDIEVSSRDTNTFLIIVVVVVVRFPH